ncbi:6-hydroxymethylpterin diphosphokinase MptE-like protein [Sulfurimonas sp.]|uniref:6-hydroxymethylpterin diphosphokinase MptE-like protein n=1 Tax=Sulfurimonas sp. TaxID=2022749 RepID=UPI003D14F914
MNEKIFLAPYNDNNITFSKSLQEKHSFVFLGYVDKSAQAENIINPQQLLQQEYDKVIICATEYFQEIYKEYIALNIPKNKIYFYIPQKNLLTQNLYLYKILRKTNVPTIQNKKIDFELYFGRNAKQLQKLHNLHKHERAFIIGNGPSLSISDLELLQNEITFAANKIYLAFEKTSWRPTYYFVEDDLVFQQNYEHLSQIKLKKFFPTYTKRYAPPIKDAIYYRLNFSPYKKNFPQFGNSPKNFYWGSTVIYSMIQMAIYMGIKQIYLLGIDFNFNVSNLCELNEDGRQNFIYNGENNHFVTNYRTKGEKWNAPNLHIQQKVFQNLATIAHTNSIEIINLSRKTKLDVFKLKNIEDIFNTSITNKRKV